MGLTAIIVDLDTKEYIWLDKQMYAADDKGILHEFIEVSHINALLQFLNDHKFGNIRYGFADSLIDFIQKCYKGSGWDIQLLETEFKELFY